jgi:hypothetical protein
VIATNAALLTFALGFLALTALLCALLARRVLGQASVGIGALEGNITGVTHATPAGMIRSRERLKELGSATEHALWSMTRFDRRIEALRSAIAARRVELEKRRAMLVSARSNVKRVKSGIRLLIGVIELRRTILG